MAEVDTSIYKTTPPPAFNPLATFGQVVGIQNAQQQNKLLQQQQDLRAGMGDAYRQAVDPETGKVDTNKLQAIISQDPRTGWNSGDVIAQAQSNTTATEQAQQEQLKNILAHTQAANSIITATMSDPGLGKVDLHDKIVQGINDMSAHGDSMMTGKKAKELADTVPLDPAGQYQWIQQKAAENSAIQGHVGDILQRTYGSPVTTDNGQQITGGVQRPVNPQAGGGALVMPPQAGVQKVTTPGENAAIQTVTIADPNSPDPKNPTYIQVPIPRSSMPGASGVAGGGNRLTAPPGAPTPTGAPTATGATRGAKPAAPAAAPQFLSAPPQGQPAELAADQAKYNSDMAAVGTHATNVQSLDKARIALEALSGPLGTGKGTETLAHLKSVMTSLGIGFDESTLNHDLAKKYLLNYAKNQGAAANSNLQLEASTGSQASTDISNQAALKVVKTNTGLENQAIAMALESQQHDKSGNGHLGRSAKFATDTDPYAFAWNRFTPEEQNAHIAELKKAGGNGYSNFLKSLEIAHKHNLIPGPPR